MNIKEILKMTPATLAQQQHEALTKAVMAKLDRVRTLIQNEDYEELERMIEVSPAGDCMGDDNMYIDFSDIYGEDIGDVIGKLTELKVVKDN